VVELRPGYLDAASRLGQLELAEGNADEARRLFEAQINEGKPNETALLGLAYIARMQGDNGTAEFFYREAIDLDITVPTALIRLARLYLEQNRQAEALDLLATAPEDDEEVIRLKAQANYQAGRYEDSIPIFERLLTLHPSDSGLLNDLANCYARLERHQDAEKCYRRALSVNPAEIAAARNLGVTLIRLNRPQEAVLAFEQSLAHNDRQPDIYQILGDLFSSARDFGQALPLYERVLAIEPGDSLALFRVAECYLAMGHEDAARLGYARVLERDPQFEPARQRLARLSGWNQEKEEPVGPDGQSTQKRSAPLLS
jgi:tetratricopeptide (TPR) repeat protein